MHSVLAPDRVHAAVDLLIMTVREGRLNLLLSRRTEAPCAGQWALPGRLIAPEESAETTAAALLDALLPQREVFLEQLYTFTDVGRDPRGRILSIAYLVILPTRPGEEALSGQEWFSASIEGQEVLLKSGGQALRGEELAFDHGKIIHTGILRLRGKIDYTPIGFHFLRDPHAFSLSELQTIFEAVLDVPLDSSNFRRSILHRYESAGQMEQTDRAEKRGRGRPAALYRLAQ